MLIESNESQLHSNKANWIKWRLIAIKQIYLNEMNGKCIIQTKLIDTNKTYLIKWKVIFIKQNELNQMKAKCIKEKLIDSKWNPIAFKQI